MTPLQLLSHHYRFLLRVFFPKIPLWLQRFGLFWKAREYCAKFSLQPSFTFFYHVFTSIPTQHSTIFFFLASTFFLCLVISQNSKVLMMYYYYYTTNEVLLLYYYYNNNTYSPLLQVLHRRIFSFYPYFDLLITIMMLILWRHCIIYVVIIDFSVGFFCPEVHSERWTSEVSTQINPWGMLFYPG